MKKVKEIDDEDEWSIKGFKSFSIAAVEYFPEYTSTDAAIKRMRHDIENDAQLLADLKPTHYTHKTARRLARQHDRIGAVVDSVCHIPHLSTRGTRVADHGI